LSVANRVVQNGADFTERIGLVFYGGSRWVLYIVCVPASNPNRYIWSGSKTVGTGPAGGYVRNSDTLNGPQVASGPDCIVIEEY
jgi:hypothetical protein